MEKREEFQIAILPCRKLENFLESHRETLDWIAAAALAFLPVLQFFRGPVIDAASSLLIIVFPYLFLRLIGNLSAFSFSDFLFVFPLILFFIYKMADHGTSVYEVLQTGAMCFYLLCLVCRLIDAKKVIRAATWISAFAGAVLFFQYFCFYILGFHLQVIPASLLTPESDAWVLLAKTGLISVDGILMDFYRPSAFFLEPSHLFLYAFPCLFLSLFSWYEKKESRICALLISLALVLSTSGMGIGVLLAAWVIFLAFRNENGTFAWKNICRMQNWLFLLVFFLAGGVLALTVPFLRESIVRLAFRDGGIGPVNIRVSGARDVLSQVPKSSRFFGVSDTIDGITCNMPGLAAVLYKYGYLGMLLSYGVYVQGLRQRLPYFCIALLILAVSFVSAHTHGSFHILYYTIILWEDRNDSSAKKKAPEAHREVIQPLK